MATDRYYFGSGRVYLASRHNNTPQGFVFLGNCPQLQLIPGNRGLEFAAANADDPEPFFPVFADTQLKLVLDDWKPDTLAYAVQGSQNSYAGGSVSNETLTCTPGSSVPLAHINLSGFTSLTSNPTGTTYTVGKDYTVDLPGGLVFFPASTTIPVNQALYANYAYGTTTVINGENANPPEYWLRFVGSNLANQNLPVALDCFRVRLQAAATMDFISQMDLGTVELTGVALYDATETGVYQIRQT